MSPDRQILTRISDTELNRRWSAVRAAMADRNIDALVMQNTSDWIGGYVRWFTDIPATNGYPRSVIFYKVGPMTVVEMGPFGQRRALDGKDALHRGVGEIFNTPSFASISYTHGYDGELIAAALKRQGVRKIGVLGIDQLPAGFIAAIKAALPEPRGAEDACDLVDPIKAIKSEEEIGLIRRAAAMQDAAFAEVLSKARPGMRDFEIAGIAWQACQNLGSEQGITLGGSTPVGRASVFVPRYRQNRKIEPGDQLSLLIETNGLGGMYTEIARTMVFGRASAELLDAFATVEELQRETLSHMRPGALPREIAAANDEALRSRGLSPELRLYSHGQGYDMVERPLIRRDETMELAAGMNLAVHPGFETPSVLGVICDNYLIGPNGAGECLHRTEKRIFELT
jgi:Xaa-Pro aminopeptidase